ncbi:hypothetical protein BLNAU_22643 [Blattamonas nauphoetae]|uniref:Protein kinase domain-containing protein n=1 Tax=Blattamonas nauphoetae TaxID=2049346 RepID=A0ABQ9WSZ7_9EUKA|nr:hypothetical protein BLNAU_22643 [Blattamonas nauphoetae]
MPDRIFSSENSITFSQCDFTAADRNIGEAALSFTDFAGKIKLENCAFTRDPSHDGWNKGCFTVTSDTFIDFTCTGCAFSRCRSDEFGSAIDIFIDSDYPIDSRSQILLTTTNFSDCFSASTGGALRLFGPIGEQILTNLRFVGCSSERGRGGSFAVTHFRSSVTISSLLCENSHSGYMEGSAHISMNPSSDDTIVFILSNSIFKSCSAVKLNVGIEPFTGALSIDSSGEGKACTATIEGCLFEECSAPAIGALSLSIPFHTTVSGCSFVKCVAPSYGSAMSLTSDGVGSLILQDIQIINCSLVSCIELSYYTTKPVIFTRVLFANEDQSINLEDHEDGLPFCEIQVYNGIPHDQPYSLTIENCWTTAARPTIFEYADHSAGAQNVGPLLTTQVKGETNGAGKLRVEIEAWFPNVEQQCEVKMREKGNEEEITFTILMNGSKGMSDWFVPGTIPADKLLGKTFTLTSIIALRGSDQPSSNAVFTFAKVPLLFDLTANSSFLTFTLPSTLPAIVSNADAALVSDDSNLATITLEGQNSLSGSMECTVMEDGKEVSFTVQMRTLAGVFIGTSHEIVVVGKDRVLTHNTTYKVLSLRKSPNNTADDVPIEIVEGLSFTIPLSSFPDKKTLSPEMKTLLSWLIPLVCVLVLCLIVSIVVIVIVHKRKKATEARMKEMAEQDPPDSIEVKVEEVKETAGVQQISQLVEQNAFIHTESGKTLLTDQDKTDREQTLGEPMDVMMCGEKCEVTVIGATTTLYEKLHKDGTGFDKRAVQKALVKGVGALVELNTETAALRQMSPHSVFVDKQNRVFIQLRFDEHARIEAMIREMNEAQKQETDPTKPPANTEQKADYLRWQPPEVVEKQEQIDNGKASVFSLGLLLWEIETRLVPFAEQDVVNACRQMGLGIVPPMQKVRDEDLKEMLVRCLSVDPDNRPPLTELTSFIDTHSFRDSPPNSHQPYHSPA